MAAPRGAAARTRTLIGRISRRLLLPAAVILPLCILAMAAWIVWTSTWDEAEAEVARTADAAAAQAQSIFDQHRLRAALVDTLLGERTDAEVRAEEAVLHVRLRRALGLGASDDPPPFTLWVFDRTGRLLVNTETAASPQADFSDRDYFRALAAPDAPPVDVGEVVVGRVTGQLNFGLSIPRMQVDRAPGFNGLVNLSVAPLALAAQLARLHRVSGDLVSLVREDGAVLTRTLPPAHPPPWHIGTDTRTMEMLRSGAPHFETFAPSAFDGVTRLLAYRKLQGWPIYAAAGRDRAAVIARWQQRMVPLLTLGVPATLALVLLAALVRRAQKAAEAAQAGLEVRVRQRTSELATSEERLRLALEAADLGTWSIACPGGALERSARAAAILGVPEEGGLRSWKEWLALIHPGDRVAAEEAYRALCAGEAERYALEFRVVQPDGSWRWVESRGRAVEHDAKGEPVRLAGTLQDVTARRETEERRALLAREVDHRAKNALAVVQAALRLTPRSDPAGYAAAVEGRVTALARAHTLLADRNWAGAELRTLLEGELKAFLPDGAGSAAPRAALDGPALRVAASSAQSLSLAFHELAMNATKYGALAAVGGRLAVSWRVDEAAGLLRLDWRESGGPAVPGPPARRGFGSRVVTATVRDQLGGSLEQAWLPDGLEVAMTIPLERVRAGVSAGFDTAGAA